MLDILSFHNIPKMAELTLSKETIKQLLNGDFHEPRSVLGFHEGCNGVDDRDHAGIFPLQELLVQCAAWLRQDTRT